AERLVGSALRVLAEEHAATVGDDVLDDRPRYAQLAELQRAVAAVALRARALVAKWPVLAVGPRALGTVAGYVRRRALPMALALHPQRAAALVLDEHADVVGLRE